MSEERIFELHCNLAEKLIEEAKVTKSQNVGMSVRLNGEIISLRREISKEIQKIRGTPESTVPGLEM